MRVVLVIPDSRPGTGDARDELILCCRDERAKAYIGEAVACYRAGAYRAAIISTWIAVAFDIVDKVRELSFAGDRAAEELTERFDAITRDNDLTRALQFERDLLANARTLHRHEASIRGLIRRHAIR